MSETIDQVLQRVYDEGTGHDASTDDRSHQMLNITPETGEFLDQLMTAAEATRVLELGTSNGYSTIWLARAARRIDAKVISVEYLPSKVAAAAKNINASGLGKTVDLKMLNIGKFLKSADDASFDFVFLDADRSHYRHWFADLRRVCDWGTLVVDNAVSHEAELQPLIDAFSEDGGYHHTVLPIGKGQLIIRRTDCPLPE